MGDNDVVGGGGRGGASRARNEEERVLTYKVTDRKDW